MSSRPVRTNAAVPVIESRRCCTLGRTRCRVDRRCAERLAFAVRARTRHSPRRKVPFDWVGQATAVLAMGGLTFGAIDAGADGLTAPTVVTALAVAVVALAAFLA